MAAKVQPRARRDGSISYRQPFRLTRGGQVTYETFDTYEDAARFGRLADQVGGMAAREVRTKSTTSADRIPTLATWLETHLTALGASATPGTVAEYRRMAARTWGPRLGPLPLDAIGREAVTAWVAWQRRQTTVRGRPYSPKSIANAKCLLSSVLAAAVDAEMIPRNVAHGVPVPSDQERAEMTFLSHNEFTTLLGAVAPPWQPLVAFLAGTGCRFGEATALVGPDFDLDARQPVVRISRAWKKGATGVYLGSPKSKRGVRTVTLPASLLPQLRTLVAAAGPGLVFTTSTGTRVQSQHFHRRVWAPALARAGLPKRPRVHDLRHSHVAWLIAEAVSLPVIQRRLGHEDIRTTVNTYGHLAPDAHAGAALAADVALAGAFPQIEG